MLGHLATGGMAEILLARLWGPADFKRPVVIKRILREHAQKDAFVTMFLDEARIAAKIQHPNVVSVLELGEEEGDVYLVLEYVAGENVSTVLKRAFQKRETVDPVLAAHIVAEACAGLHAAHELVGDDGKRKSLVHRDVSPSNLFVAYDGHVKLLDFGVALTEERYTQTVAGEVKGKFEYMSPEQIRGEPLDRRSDIFAMGVVLYEASTGRRLFHRISHARTIDAICKEPVVPPSRIGTSYPPELEKIVMKALSKKPDDRYATAAEMRRDLLDVRRALPAADEVLAARMKTWFEDRIAEKEDMVRRVSEGAELSRVPTSDPDIEVQIPDAPTALMEPVRERRFLIGAGGLAIAAAATVAFATFLPRGNAPATRLVTRTNAEPPTSETPPVPAPPGSVLVHVESKPRGARVFVDGNDRGAAPLDLHFARGTSTIALELRRTGYDAVHQTIVPDADQKILLSLTPSGPKGRAKPPTVRTPANTTKEAPPTPPQPPPPAATESAGFHRFD